MAEKQIKNDSKIPPIDGATVTLRDCTGSMFLSQHVAEGKTTDETEVPFTVTTVIPSGDIVIDIGGGDYEQKSYIVTMRDVLSAALEAYGTPEKKS